MWGSKGKFISVFFIILLGAAVFSGLRASRGDMLLSAERYYDEYNLSDITVMSTAGLTDDDLNDILSLPEVVSAEGVYSLDVLGSGEARPVIKLLSLPSKINLPSEVEGRLPSASGECLADKLLKDVAGYSIGDTIQFDSGEDGSPLALAVTGYTITGFADLPQYMDINSGTGTVGKGETDGFMLILPEDFTAGYYTQINVTVKGAAALDSFEEEYDGVVSSAKDSVSSLSASACERRKDELVEEIISSLPFPVPPEQVESLVPQPEWYVLDRNAVMSYVNFGNDAERIASLAQIIPIVFFLVAALVSLTAMTRMVEEERQQIGTLKALGVSNFSVFSRYLLYALIPTLLGSVAGVLIGEKLFPFAIINTYKMLYTGLKYVVIPYNLVEGIIAVVAGVISTGVAAFAASLKISREVPAIIMRPEAPKPGKRVLLERITPVWNRLSFTQKSTVRNLFLNKKRFIMTVIGIAGCMGLVLVGLGLHDSIMVVVDKQFEELTHYQASVTVSEMSSEDRGELLSDISSMGDISSFVLFQRSVDIQGDSPQTVTLSVPETEDGIEKYFTFRERLSRKGVSVGEGAIISEKTAKSLGVSVGDSIELRQNDVTASVEITGIFENYIGHYLFMSSQTYESLFGEAPAYNVILLNFDDNSEAFRDEVGTALMSEEGVQGVSFVSTTVDWANDTLASLNTIVFIVLGAAALLAAVVLYNLNSINIAERKRELATLKVLGFHDKEVAAYVYKENILLTILGIILGIGLGILLHQYVIQSIEVDLIMFGRNIYWYSYLAGSLLTFAFSVIINFAMFGSIKRINMVESLKSAE